MYHMRIKYFRPLLLLGMHYLDVDFVFLYLPSIFVGVSRDTGKNLQVKTFH
jgi:hypothetical protein